MSTLANTKWSATVQEGGTQTWEFKSDGTLTILFPNNQSDTAYYAELSDGTFVFQMPKSSANPNINNVYFGRHRNGQGIGDWVHYEGNGNESVLLPFSMTKSS
ncbi:hypothetical protein SAMN05421640_2746 [Ekhidna lutea]|uniref:Uncharacterized protein n=1 Tax=Ekhidna lutea TaxID=447679 RepID=A0A239KMI7_EKHLU|nr:hypothetical protein [Ekhidna lutea]SNT18932.1 hypothetical protein SAMN05421640_2746 [Ekhidna lutea]